MVMKERWTMPAGLRRASALVAIVALAVGGAKVVDDRTVAGSGFSAVATVAADPSGPPGPTGGVDGGMNGSQFQPPQMPSSMPDYQGGNNQPPMDQNSGISIYNSGNPQAPQQVPGQQAGQQPQQAQQPAHGTQIPDYQTATPYTQGPGKANPDYQAPQQNAPQQGQQPQQQQPQQQQPSQAPTQTQQPEQPQNKQDQDTQQLNDQQRQQQCQQAMAESVVEEVPAMMGGAGRSPIWFIEPGRDPQPPTPSGGDCSCATPKAGKGQPSTHEWHWWGERTYFNNQADLKEFLSAMQDAQTFDNTCAAIGGTGAAAAGGVALTTGPGAAVAVPVGIVLGVVGGLCGISSAAYDGPLVNKIADTISQGKCLRFDNRILFYTTDVFNCPA
ncbi:hypothetical protein [Mycobacteroides abscessus]|uniref:hypothetical protein n=1 Tax=Mycobacteroides abscessus TaxID=36809 RepID=UPI0009A7816A|nr:hypothetical protein [Mycobacteroides abscessus]